MAIGPTHKLPAGGLPRNFFVGRNQELSIFTKTLESECAPDEYSILTISALGGQGKSSLLARMREVLKDEKYLEFPSASIDFDLAAQRDPINALLSLRNQFAAAGIRTNSFDIAFVRHFVLTQPGRNIRTDHPELFTFTGDLLSEVVDSLGDVITELPGAKLVIKITSRLSQKAVDWYRKRGEPLLAQLDETPAHLLRRELPMFLGADLTAFCADNAEKRPVIFYDTHEALWRGTQRIDFAAETAPDSWLRRFVQESPRVLHVIAGRSPLDWAKIDTDWDKHITSIDLRELDSESAAEIFDRAALKSETIRERILSTSRGHALTLRVNVRIYETLIAKGSVPEIDDFPLIAREALDRLFDHLDPNTRAVIRTLAVPSYIDDEIWQHLSTTGHVAFAYVNKKEMLDEIYFRKDRDGRYLMHELVRDGLLEYLTTSDPELLNRVNSAMFEFHNRKSLFQDGEELSLADRDRSVQQASNHLLAFHPQRFATWCLDRFTTDLVTVSSVHRPELIARAREQVKAEGQWENAIKLAYLEIRIDPFAELPFELLRTALANTDVTKLDPDSFQVLRNALWTYRIAERHDWYNELAPLIFVREPKPEMSNELEFLHAVDDGLRDQIEAELAKYLVFWQKRAGTKEPTWCLLVGTILTENRNAINVLRDYFSSCGDSLKVTWIFRLLEAANSFEKIETGLRIALDALQISEPELATWLVSADTDELFKRRLTSQLPAKAQADIEAAMEVYNSEPITYDVYVTARGELCIIYGDIDVAWRELDYFIYKDFRLYFCDRLLGKYTLEAPVPESFRQSMLEGAAINFVSYSKHKKKVFAGAELLTFTPASDEPLKDARIFDLPPVTH